MAPRDRPTSALVRALQYGFAHWIMTISTHAPRRLSFRHYLPSTSHVLYDRNEIFLGKNKHHSTSARKWNPHSSALMVVIPTICFIRAPGGGERVGIKKDHEQCFRESEGSASLKVSSINRPNLVISFCLCLSDLQHFCELIATCRYPTQGYP